MIVIGVAPVGRGCASACTQRSSAGPAAVSAAPARSTVRRSISLSPAAEGLAISPSMALWGPRSSGHRRLQTSFDPGQGNRSLRTPAPQQDLSGFPEKSGNGRTAQSCRRVNDWQAAIWPGAQILASQDLTSPSAQFLYLAGNLKSS